jgi:hypothetical protein
VWRRGSLLALLGAVLSIIVLRRWVYTFGGVLESTVSHCKKQLRLEQEVTKSRGVDAGVRSPD